MINWFKNKNYPGFWKAYQAHFKNKKETPLQHTRFVVFDTETTGLQISKDRILSIGAIAITGNILDVADSLELYIKQEVFKSQTVAIHGILKEGNILKVDEKEGMSIFLDYIKDAILVAHHAAFDIAMINVSLTRLGLPKLKNKVLDTGILFKKTSLCKATNQHYSLDKLSELFHIKKHDRHTASGDAFITGLVFLKIIANLHKTRKIELKDLFFRSNREGLL